MSKILYIFDANDWGSRIPVAQAALERGHDVMLGLIGGDEKTAQQHNFNTRIIHKKTGSFGLSSFFNLTGQIRDLVRDEKPDIIHAVTLKYAFTGAIAALRNPNIHKVFTLAGLGYMFHGNSAKSDILRAGLKPVLSFLFKRPNTTLIFQNPDDMNTMISRGYVNAEKCALIRGSGVDLTRFAQSAAAEENAAPIVLMPTRLVHEKGIAVFIEAAKILRRQGVNAIFRIAGGETSHNPKAIQRDEMLGMLGGSDVEWLGRVSDMPALLSRAALIVYPSYYGEGIPRVLLEACAAGKAIITTDHTGCREAVTHGLNGLLVPIKDPQATADAIAQLLGDPQTRKAMAAQSKARAAEEFDIQKIAQQTVALYDR